MKTTCPNVVITRWFSRINGMTWFKKHIIVVKVYLNEKLPPCRPSAILWMLRMTLHSFAQEVSLVFMRLQGMTTLMFQQMVELSNLLQMFCRLVGGKVSLFQSELQAMAEAAGDSGDHVMIGQNISRTLSSSFGALELSCRPSSTRFLPRTARGFTFFNLLVWRFFQRLCSSCRSLSSKTM